MKIRNGFVSNSSSSSFILIVKKEAYDAEYNKLDDVSKQIVATVFSAETVVGQPCMVYGSYYGMDGEGWPNSDYTWDEVTLEGDEDPMEIVDQFKTALGLHKEAVFTHHLGNG